MSKKGKVIEPNEGRGKVHVVVENLLHDYIQKTSTLKMELFLDDISHIIPDAILTQWVNANRALFLGG